MRTEQEMRELKEALERLTGFIADFGTAEEFDHAAVSFANDLVDTLAWALGEIATQDLRGEGYLDMEYLRSTAAAIERRTGKKLADY